MDTKSDKKKAERRARRKPCLSHLQAYSGPVARCPKGGCGSQAQGLLGECFDQTTGAEVPNHHPLKLVSGLVFGYSQLQLLMFPVSSMPWYFSRPDFRCFRLLGTFLY